MRVRRAVVAMVLGVAITSCGDNGSTPATTVQDRSTTTSLASTTTRLRATTTTIAAPVVQAVIDVGGTQLLGLALTADAVWPVSFDAGTISRVDPTTNTVVTTYEIDGAASAASVNGAVWVATYGGPFSALALDPATGVIRVRAHAGELCCDLTSDLEGDVWAIDPAGRLLEFSDGGVSRGIAVGLDARNAHTSVVFAGTSLWASSDTTALHRVDPMTGEVVDVDVGGGVPFVVHDGLLWGASATEVWAVDPATSQVAERIRLDRSAEVMTLEFDDDGDLWAGIRRAGGIGAVLQIDRASGAVKTELRDIEIPARIVRGFGSIWITDSASSSLYRIAP